MIADGSMKVPAINSTMFTTIRNSTGEKPWSTTQRVIDWGICSVVRTWANSMALAMMNISTTVSLPASISTRWHCRSFMSLCTKTAMMAA